MQSMIDRLLLLCVYIVLYPAGCLLQSPWCHLGLVTARRWAWSQGFVTGMSG